MASTTPPTQSTAAVAGITATAAPLITREELIEYRKEQLAERDEIVGNIVAQVMQDNDITPQAVVDALKKAAREGPRIAVPIDVVACRVDGEWFNEIVPADKPELWNQLVAALSRKYAALIPGSTCVACERGYYIVVSVNLVA